MPAMEPVGLDGIATHLDALCDRVRAEAPIELGGARRHARAGIRSKMAATIAGKEVELAEEAIDSYNSACKFVVRHNKKKKNWRECCRGSLSVMF